ncbi:MAG: Gfo/Idh/MocA family oxidoreductase [Actinomycetota bacterium]|nr:Gfo/Idh/MocA family oxidoreductase [Actinomycetota bacterium]
MSRTVRFGLIGGGLMGREFASAAARWVHLADIGVRPEVAVVCDVNPDVLAWYERLDPPPLLVSDYAELLADESVEAVYCAVPHNLHEELYTAILRARKHLLGEKPFGIDLDANEAILAEIARHPELLVRCSSELPFYPGGQEVVRWIRERRFGRVLEVRSLFHHSSDLDPSKPINWKRRAAFNGEYGCMGDLGMHPLHIPLRADWAPRNVRAILSDVVVERPDGKGGMAPCDTWDNAVLLCEAKDDGKPFPLRIETKRIAPGETNTWTIEIDGTEGSIAYTTKQPKTLRWMEYEPGARQAWQAVDLGSESAYPTITGAIFEFGFSDAILQMWAAFLDELAHGRDGMRQPFHCATPEEAAATHRLFTAALRSHAEGAVVAVD